MPQPIDMGPQPEASRVQTAEAMRISFSHKCSITREESDYPETNGTTELEIFYPINDDVWLPIFPQCATCGAQLFIVNRERVAVR